MFQVDKRREVWNFCTSALLFLISCFSTTYVFEWSMSQSFQCSIPVNNISLRLGLGFIGAPTGFYLLAIPIKAIDEALGDSDVAIRGEKAQQCE